MNYVFLDASAIIYLLEGDPGLSVVELDRNVIDRATQLRAQHGLRTPDALQAASALELSDNPTFVTGDSDFKKIKNLNVHQIQ